MAGQAEHEGVTRLQNLPLAVVKAGYKKCTGDVLFFNKKNGVWESHFQIYDFKELMGHIFGGLGATRSEYDAKRLAVVCLCSWILMKGMHTKGWWHAPAEHPT